MVSNADRPIVEENREEEIDEDDPQWALGNWDRDDDGSEKWYSFQYERLPIFCRRCGMIEHRECKCANKSEEQFMEQLIGRMAEQTIESQGECGYFGDWLRVNPEEDDFKFINKEESVERGRKVPIEKQSRPTNAEKSGDMELSRFEPSASPERVTDRLNQQAINLSLRRRLFQDMQGSEINQNLTFHVVVSPAGKEYRRVRTREESMEEEERRGRVESDKMLTDGGR
uniref:Zinc knuckle CX2CX4HX4C domain-containing protein n=1 Tax=Nelumbo nucifera TaxID=4432 RepID=A0A822XFP2_NELNU|nr:TPA_asm: hypothetical protein HUJ06_019384 [Nelumbo nucifera]